RCETRRDYRRVSTANCEREIRRPERSWNCSGGKSARAGPYRHPRTRGYRVADLLNSRDGAGKGYFPSEAPIEIARQLNDCLNENNVQYEILHHSEAVTAQRIAQAEHVKGRHQAKVVMVKAGDQHLMMVLPADHHIDLEKVEKTVGEPVSLAKENEFESLFPDSAIGAMPPFGNLYGL